MSSGVEAVARSGVVLGPPDSAITPSAPGGPGVAAAAGPAGPARDVRDARSWADREARLVLSCITDAGSTALAEAVALHGARLVLDAVTDRSGGLRGVDRWWRRLQSFDVDTVHARAAAVGARFVVPGDDEWCAGLGDLVSVRSSTSGGGVPVGLWVRGRPFDGPAVAVVGTREATAYGAAVAADMGAELAGAGVAVVSGGALGIDAAAHRGALAAGGPTIAVLACGIDVAYPRGHADLLARIAQEGLVVAEMPPGATPTRQGFLTRNRLVAAMSGVTVVVEAALRSGALNTASWAQSLVRVVAAVPGPVTSPLSAGCHRLIREAGAVLVTGADEILELVAPLSGAGPVPAAVLDPRAGLDDLGRRVLEAVPARGGVGLARLVAATGDAPLVLLATLGELGELDLVEQDDRGWRLSATERAATRSRSAAPGG